jgi:hypothetical protein
MLQGISLKYFTNRLVRRVDEVTAWQAPVMRMPAPDSLVLIISSYE